MQNHWGGGGGNLDRVELGYWNGNCLRKHSGNENGLGLKNSGSIDVDWMNDGWRDDAWHDDRQGVVDGGGVDVGCFDCDWFGITGHHLLGFALLNECRVVLGG